MKKNISLLKIFTVLILIFLTNRCTKIQNKTNQNLLGGKLTDVFLLSSDSANIHNYFIINLAQLDGRMDSSFKITAAAVFTDSVTGVIQPVTSVTVNTRVLNTNSNNTYGFIYSDTSLTLAEGKALAGATAKIKIVGSSSSDTVTNNVYVPKDIVRLTSDLPNTKIFTGSSLPITWVADPSNPLGQIVIQVEYDSLQSHLNDSTLPLHINPLQYFVTDNGSYTISSSDLSVFPAKSLVIISLARASETQQVLPVSRRRVFYFGISCAFSISLQMCTPCTGANCASPSHKCVYGACATGAVTVVQTYSGGKCTTTTEYIFPDGSVNVISTVVVNGPCT